MMILTYIADEIPTPTQYLLQTKSRLGREECDCEGTGSFRSDAASLFAAVAGVAFVLQGAAFLVLKGIVFPSLTFWRWRR
jgi:hypothetical protein